jgi:DDE superfamily endonuclease
MLWLEHFEKQTRPDHPEEWRLLVYDGHGSHMSLEFITYCWDHMMVPFLLPSHTTHLLQPLDVGVFQPLKQHHQNIMAEQIRFGGMNYTKSDFFDAFQEIRDQTMKKRTIIHSWEKAGLWPFNPKLVLSKLKEMAPFEEPTAPNRFATPEPVESTQDWATASTPELTLQSIKEYSVYIDKRLAGAIDQTIPLSPTVARVIAKRDKAQNTLLYSGKLAEEELHKRKEEEMRRARHKKEGGQRRVTTEYGVILASDARLRISGHESWLRQRRELHIDRYDKMLGKNYDLRLGITFRAACRWRKVWQEEVAKQRRLYSHWMAELTHFFETGSRILLFLP